MSNKRILPALLLCFTIGFLGAHRIYVGRFISGLIQLAASVGSFLWLKQECASLFEITTVEQAIEWATQNQPPLAPILLFCAAGMWVSADCVAILAKGFKDHRGQKLTQWT